MKDIFKKHRQDFNEIRRLCLICHGIDLTTSSLSSKHSRLKISDETEIVLQNMVTSNLLNLAISIRINLYQKSISQSNKELLESAWLYFDKKLLTRPATLKQVCDKIIHADSVTKSILHHERSHDSQIAIQFKGVEQNRKHWTLDIVLQRFCEDVLCLLDEIESSVKTRPERQPS